MDRNENYSINLYEEIHKIIKNAVFIFLQDKEDFSYLSSDNEIESTTVGYLVHLKYKIHFKSKKENKEIKKEDDKLFKKCEELIFFKGIISNIEIVNEYMTVLRTKESSIPIDIKFEIKYPGINYYLKDKKIIEFQYVTDFLFKAKTDYISQLNSVYKEKDNL